MAQQSIGPAQLVLTASVARRYYLDGRSKLDIAEEFGISRFKVARLLEAGRAAGLVHVEIRHPGNLDVELSAELQSALGLRHAIVVDTLDDDPALLRAQIGRAGGELVSEIVTSDDVLGLGWARSLIAMRDAMTRLAPCPVVQLTGALSRPDIDGSSIELVRDVARLGGGEPYFFYAPMIVPDATTAGVLRRQPDVARCLEKAAVVTTAVVGLGSWDPPYSTVWDAISPAERADLHELGVRADVSGILLAGDGQPVPAPLADRLIGIDAAQLHRIPEVIALAYAAEKAAAVRAAVRGGYVTSLVTHTRLARAILGRS
ncbi:transcriptional regulator [Cellulomonas chitinilytica]|uniref:Transcriptional regulator n=1 Tax=Cellulomonas chitinilytica TaxID=398759 RepID=A0A919U505_9CELL|nr:sugar-binding domain-containing protein [Cellulomonas chitinilytica]GIG23679.1 transcriptional regulator [Cellulomonas chitinilytica]